MLSYFLQHDELFYFATTVTQILSAMFLKWQRNKKAGILQFASQERAKPFDTVAKLHLYVRGQRHGDVNEVFQKCKPGQQLPSYSGRWPVPARFSLAKNNNSIQSDQVPALVIFFTRSSQPRNAHVTDV